MARARLTSTYVLSKGVSPVKDHEASAEVAALLKARRWSLKLLLVAVFGVMAAVTLSIWSTVAFMPYAMLGSGPGPWGVSDWAVAFVVFGGSGALLLPLVMILIFGCFVLIHRPPLRGADPLSWSQPASRFSDLQAELVALAVFAGVVALGYAGASVLALTVSRSQLMEVPQIRGINAPILASSLATLCLLGVLLTYWWILGIPSPVPSDSADTVGADPDAGGREWPRSLPWTVVVGVVAVVVVVVMGWAVTPNGGPSSNGPAPTANGPAPTAIWLATDGTTSTLSEAAGVVHYGVELVNDTATTMFVDSAVVVTEQGKALSGRAASELTATVAPIDAVLRPPPLPAGGFPIEGHGGKAVVVVTVQPQCPGLAIPGTAKIVVAYHNTSQSFSLTAYGLTGAGNPLKSLVQQACGQK